MIPSQYQSGNRTNLVLRDIIRQTITALKPDLDWLQIEFEECPGGQLIRLTSGDPAIHQWLQQTITITRPDPGQDMIVYYNAFYSASDQQAGLPTTSSGGVYQQ